MIGKSRTLSLLLLFSEEDNSLSAEEIAQRLGATLSTTYRDLKKLRELGLVETVPGERFILGGQISILDRIARLGTPLLKASIGEMERLAKVTGVTVTLTRLYFDSIIGLGHVEGDRNVSIGYERGQVVPLFYGCTGKSILGALPWRQLKRIFEANTNAIRKAGLGGSWDAFLGTVRTWDRDSFLWTEGEINPDNIAVATAVLGADAVPLGSLTLIIRRRDISLFDRSQIETELMRSRGKIQSVIAESAMSDAT
ncbi:MAG: HTH domain-containing protein [Mesorhizobium sp.]|nr:MAG: HTH domain-containing protein [Mesorhizobium sp.]